MFTLGEAAMREAGFTNLTIRHWARRPGERNLYNRLVKEGRTCLPFGCGAGGKVGRFRFFQENQQDAYLGRVERGEKPVVFAVDSGPLDDLFNTVTGQVELGGIDPASLSGVVPGRDPAGCLAPLLAQWCEAGLLTRREDGVHTLTTAGRFWNVNIAQGLIDWLAYFMEAA
jgi:oxygen-independent coproporphyrinogen-3 oxidase